jgi:hypothetical protein
MSLGARVAVVVGLLCLSGALLATFLPASAGPDECGTWVAPEYGDDETEAMLEETHGLYLDARASGQDAIAGQAVGVAAMIRRASVECGDTLGTRRMLGVGLLGFAVVGPVAVMFIGGKRQSG